MLRVTRLEARSKSPTKAITAVSDTHGDEAAPVGPTRQDTAGVYTEAPRFAPITVTLNEPVPNTLTFLTALSCTVSTENTFVLLPTLYPTVAYTRRDDKITPSPARQLIDVSALHTVASHPLWRMLARAECPPRPIPDPCKVILADPVDAWLARRRDDIDTLSQDTPDDIEPT